jgi:hypothetical protein
LLADFFTDLDSPNRRGRDDYVSQWFALRIRPILFGVAWDWLGGARGVEGGALETLPMSLIIS